MSGFHHCCRCEVERFLFGEEEKQKMLVSSKVVERYRQKILNTWFKQERRPMHTKQKSTTQEEREGGNRQHTQLSTMTVQATPFGFGSTTTGPNDALLLSLTGLAACSLLFAFFVLRPRSKGGKNGPPVVTTSPVCGLPVVGTIVEFGKSPVKMVQRCYEDYGPVFTVPVS